MSVENRPLGVFDSGVGGLSVLREIRALLPAESLLYVADSGHAPYGPKAQSYIQQRSRCITRFLLDQGAKAIVIACNTATAAAAADLRASFPIPIIGMEPAVKPAVAATRAGVIGVLATAGTLASVQFAALLDRFGQDVRVMTQACPGLVEQVEWGEVDTAYTRLLLARYTAPMLAAGVDTIVLGCTHYPFLRPLIQEVVGAQITLVDTGAAVARQVQRVLSAQQLLHPSSTPGSEKFWTSGTPQSSQTLSLLWQKPVAVEKLSV